jgi:hypothetical protein
MLTQVSKQRFQYQREGSMDKAELKAVLKPLIKECIKEAIFEDGVLSGIISEVAQGLSAGTPLVEQRKPSPKPAKKLANKAPSQRQQIMEQERKQLLNSINKDAYNGVNVFEGTDASEHGPQPGSPLGDVASSDPGINIDGILNIAGDSWGKFI